MQPDVDHDPAGPQRLRGEVAELDGRVVEVAELVHQPLGVQRPALAVAGDELDPLEAREAVRLQHRVGDLQVVTGYGLVVPDREQPPLPEHRLAEHGQPGAARTAEVLARRRVVRRRAATGRREHRLAATHLLRDVEVGAVEGVGGVVGDLLQPRACLLGTGDRVLGVDVETGLGLTGVTPP